MYRIALVTFAGAALLSGCATANDWKGAVAEKAYDKDLEIRRLAEVANNDDYYEFEKDGRIYVITDAKDYRSLRTIGELAYSSKKIGGGPGGKTIVYGLVKSETKLLEKDPRAQGAAQKMYEGKLQGMEKNFFGLIEQPGTTYVFTSWKDLQTFKSSGNASGFSESVAGAGKVVYAGSSARPAEAADRVSKLYAP
jgi:hypothetical protein